MRFDKSIETALSELLMEDEPCPSCGAQAYVGFRNIECSGPSCQHYSPKQAEIVRQAGGGYVLVDGIYLFGDNVVNGFILFEDGAIGFVRNLEIDVIKRHTDRLISVDNIVLSKSLNRMLANQNVEISSKRGGYDYSIEAYKQNPNYIRSVLTKEIWEDWDNGNLDVERFEVLRNELSCR